jgi:hypothetical protein
MFPLAIPGGPAKKPCPQDKRKQRSGKRRLTAEPPKHSERPRPQPRRLETRGLRREFQERCQSLPRPRVGRRNACWLPSGERENVGEPDGIHPSAVGRDHIHPRLKDFQDVGTITASRAVHDDFAIFIFSASFLRLFCVFSASFLRASCVLSSNRLFPDAWLRPAAALINPGLSVCRQASATFPGQSCCRDSDPAISCSSQSLFPCHRSSCRLRPGCRMCWRSPETFRHSTVG